MKYPALLPFSELVNQLDQFDSIIDVRSPAEFALDHIPGAINCPVLNDLERIRVGTMYKQVNAFEAKKVGAALVAKNIALHIEEQFLQYPREWKPLIYCWRGGNRSGSMALILAKIGWPVVQLDGGYKAYRQHINTELSQLIGQFQYRVVCGTTGSGKSRLLQALHTQGAQVLDLEKLAEHRGSVLGDLPSTAQPSQKAFESAIWLTLRKFDSSKVVYIESESKKVGNLRVPDHLISCMRNSACISLQLPINLRVALLMQDYAYFISQPNELMKRLHYLTPLHGKEKIRHWQNLSEQDLLHDLVQELIEVHYDPSYLRSIERNFPQLGGMPTIHLNGIAELDFLQLAERLLAE
ncbi:tRNA 2-selenouridine(34) synthase MnmH [Solimicrobium silvestre]|uniref:tRNA 2-selenouridine synthase n=1 Tax=Solimicrobium silvestre TaxID=2099400 RepID=A0A2S9GX47_9BURK|nr:tRNA 2-selenouridine(34) synthase MnmH [Solimicrobium silvestre]PRC92236.1 tRNA 2-selenouridine synthase [Solimicrobium silvestre]